MEQHIPCLSIVERSAEAADDIATREFRANMKFVLRARQNPVMRRVRQWLSVPLALRQALLGICQYGWHVKQRDGVSILRQFVYLFIDYFYAIMPEDFYFYRLHLADQRRLKSRQFGFWQLLEMQKYLFESYGSEDAPLLKNKNLFIKKCLENGLPTVPLLAEFSEGKMIPHLAELPQGDLFSKPADLFLGLGANLWRYNSAGNYVHAASGDTTDAKMLIARLCEDSQIPAAAGASGRILLQEKISNHSSMIGTLTMGGLATIRLISCRAPSGSIEFLPPAIRMPLDDSFADNLHQGGMGAPIDIVSGKICGPAIRLDTQCGVSIFDTHPTTGIKLRGFQLPYWSEVLALARKAHLAFGSMHFIGWDIAILQNQPVLIEGNALWGIIALPDGVSLADTQFMRCYNYHFKRSPSTNPAPATNPPIFCWRDADWWIGAATDETSPKAP